MSVVANTILADKLSAPAPPRPLIVDRQPGSHQQVARWLGRTAFAEGLNLRDLEKLARAARPRSIAAGDVLYHQGDQADGLFALVRGAVKLSVVAPNGREAILAILRRGEVFGDLAVLDAGPRHTSAVAVNDVDALFLPRLPFLQCLDESPVALRNVVLELSYQVREGMERLTEMVFWDAEARVARRLLELGEDHGLTRADGTVEITLGLTQQEIANLAGASRETVNKALKSFRSDGVIAVSDQRIVLLDVDRLRLRAEVG